MPRNSFSGLKLNEIKSSHLEHLPAVGRAMAEGGHRESIAPEAPLRSRDNIRMAVGGTVQLPHETGVRVRRTRLALRMAL